MPSPPLQIWRAQTNEGPYLKLRYADDEGEIQFVLNPSGTKLWAAWRGTATMRDVAALVTGPVFGCLLRHRGFTCLHSSVVSVDGHALAIIGPKGAGKSTTAMGLLQRGANVVADDVAALVRQDLKFSVRACERRLRVGPASAQLFGSYEKLDPLWAPRGGNRPRKRYLNAATRGFASHADVPLAAVYVLEPRDQNTKAPCITNSSATESLTKLMANRFASYALDRSGHAKDFELLSHLASCTPVRVVHRSDNLDAVPALSEAILNDCRAFM